MRETGWTVFDRQMNPSDTQKNAEEALMRLRGYYETKIEKLTNTLINIPVKPGDKVIVVGERSLLRVLWEGEIKIKKVFSNNKYYRIKNPIVFYAYIGIFHTSWCTSLGMYPLYGFHILSGGNICFGEMQVESNKEAEYYREIIPQFVEMWETINTNSLGGICLPPTIDQEEQAAWLTIKDGVRILVDKLLIEEIKIIE